MGKRLAFEFHVSRSARDRYGFDDLLFSLTGNVIFANLTASREFAQRINQAREAERFPERAVHPGALHAMGLIDESLHAVAALYRQQRDPDAMTAALAWFGARLGDEALDAALLCFTELFPTVAIYRGQQTAAEWLADATGGVSHRAVALEETMLLWLANLNPAFRPFAELFDDRALSAASAYAQITGGLREYFETRPRFGPEEQNLVDALRAPALASPDSLEGQLAYIRDKWSPVLGDFVRRILTAFDALKEEEIAVWLRFHPPGQHFGAGQAWGDSSAAAIPHFHRKEPGREHEPAPEHESERFSPDLDWMPSTVMIAKSVYVWLDQLSKAVRRPVHRLDQVPGEELDLLARRGFNCLWLIGVWERSRASQRIKQVCGNPEAAASAYSLHGYTIAEDLGGEGAYHDLRRRASARGIRLASDMVPNHTGIDSPWVIHHPDWFLSLPQSPFPVYRFDGPDFSPDGRVEIKIEDHYFDRSDAAVVFRRTDRWTGDTRYIYHGNDGTSFPWNDTAQLDYTRAEVREAVIQAILHVARMFPVIRFDAAMTLAKRHYQRLWFPEPGSGGAIPSRAGYGMTKAEFERAIPVEFWREVVDRVASEAPGTLLLAEAFWLMEGYFVRTLGMHRVYNSAFMNMLRDEENANYRQVIKNTLAFDPEVLSRYVNFMNNPDERTAVDQFGKGGKYFGICAVMSTLPGLPMFGHGQIEGLTERYGMEYRRAYYDEQPDSGLMARHEREISPLLHRRRLFAGVREFLLYDLFTAGGAVNEDVFAYSNRAGGERALVVFHNRSAETRGWIRVSCAYLDKFSGENRSRQRTLGEAFGISSGSSGFLACRDASSGLEYLHREGGLAERGLHVELRAYQCHVFLDWRDLQEDATRPWGLLCDALAGRGVPNLQDALRELQLQPVHDALRTLLDPALAEELGAAAALPEAGVPPEAVPAKGNGMPVIMSAIPPAGGIVPEGAAASERGDKSARLSRVLETVRRRATAFFAEAKYYAVGGAGKAAGLAHAHEWRREIKHAEQSLLRRLQEALRLAALPEQDVWPDVRVPAWPADARAVLPVAGNRPGENPAAWGMTLAWAALEALGRLQNSRESDPAAVRLFDGLYLRGPLAEALAAHGLTGEEPWRAAARLRALFAHPSSFAAPRRWLRDPDVAWTIGVHEHQGVAYVVKEPLERLLWWMTLPALLEAASLEPPNLEPPNLEPPSLEPPSLEPPNLESLRELVEQIQARMRAAEEAGYRVEELEDEAIGNEAPLAGAQEVAEPGDRRAWP